MGHGAMESHTPTQPQTRVGIPSQESLGGLPLWPPPAPRLPQATLPPPRPWWQRTELGAWWQLWLTLANSLLSESWPLGKGSSAGPSLKWLSNQDPSALGAVGSPAAPPPVYQEAMSLPFFGGYKKSHWKPLVWSNPPAYPRRGNEAKAGKSPAQATHQVWKE